MLLDESLSIPDIESPSEWMDVFIELVIRQEYGFRCVFCLSKNSKYPIDLIVFKHLSTGPEEVINISWYDLKFFISVNKRKGLFGVGEINLIEFVSNLLQLGVHAYFMLKIFCEQVFKVNFKSVVGGIVLSG